MDYADDNAAFEAIKTAADKLVFVHKTQRIDHNTKYKLPLNAVTYFNKKDEQYQKVLAEVESRNERIKHLNEENEKLSSQIKANQEEIRQLYHKVSHFPNETPTLVAIFDQLNAQHGRGPYHKKQKTSH